MDYNLKELASQYGVKNLRITAPLARLTFTNFIPGLAFVNYDSKVDIVECTISEERYKVSDGYKITIVAIDPAYGRRHYYQSDLEIILRTTRKNPYTEYPIRLYVLTIDGYSLL